MRYVASCKCGALIGCPPPGLPVEGQDVERVPCHQCGQWVETVNGQYVREPAQPEQEIDLLGVG